ncbi:GNAT family N-acetyltransferase [Sinomicrobium weinanense]|uniref:GNAT family N-acetyltransferase n=1 Tax=Sinomicrobium weinanense TaxID=2842200 RepID=A0A926JQE0_9FLAO|nr:GNAT family N-acetyltransferase [Sinomicrobium weinanense]MBC9795538.1 GNAT family N-acetyltransferase [Sinomicrobium weinanense]MBU3123315.1 GNAT family N-acetyltransferase [Sinomicrobium weinanense]
MRTTDVKIRTELRPGDLGYVAWLHGKIYDQECGYGRGFESYVLEGLAEFLRDYDPAKDRVWICEDRSEMVGFLLAARHGDAIQLRYFILLPDYRGLGLGKELMQSFIGFMKETGCFKAYLWTTREQEAAIGLYERYGFRLTEEVPSETFGKHLVEQRYDLEP